MKTIPAKTILQKNKSTEWFGNDYNMKDIISAYKQGYGDMQLSFF